MGTNALLSNQNKEVQIVKFHFTEKFVI